MDKYVFKSACQIKALLIKKSYYNNENYYELDCIWKFGEKDLITRRMEKLI